MCIAFPNKKFCNTTALCYSIGLWGQEVEYSGLNEKYPTIDPRT